MHVRVNKFSCLHSVLKAGCAVVAMIGSAPSFAQPQPTAIGQLPEGANQGADVTDDIIVTARRREESIQDVPAAIQALSAEALTQRNILNESDLQTAVPGLLVRTNNNQFQLNYVMRGESFEPYSGSVPGVQPYLNEVALSGNAAPPFYDLQNVQVLKGPQGTLFGRNSTGGAVLYQTARPGPDFGGYGSFQYGSYDRLVAEAAVNLPVISEKLLIRLAGTYQSGGGYVRNIYDNTTQGDAKLKSGRVTLELNPTETFRNTTMVQFSEYDAVNIAKRVSYVAPCGTGSAHPCWMTPSNPFFQSFVNSAPGTYFPGWPNGNVYKGALADFPTYLDSFGRYTVSANGSGRSHATDTVLINTTTFELSDSLTLKNILGYSRTKRDTRTDNDNTPYPFLQTGTLEEGRDTEQLSNEIQLQGEAMGDRLTYILGAFWSDNVTEYDSPLSGFTYVPATGFNTVFNLRYRARTKDEAYALFTQGTYALTDKLNFTAGIRQSWDKLSILHLPGSIFFGGRKQETSVDDLSWTLSLDYEVTPALLTYVTTRGSWRVGGYNPFVPTGTGNRQTAATGGNYFPPETVRDVEVGFKFSDDLGGMPVRLNADFFYLWAKNIEKTGTTVIEGRVTSTTLSVPAGEVWGIEADGNVRPAPWLTLGGNFTYNVGKFTDREAVLFGVPVVYDTFPDTPKFSGTLYADVTHSLGDLGELTYHVDVYKQTSFHMTSFGKSFIPGDTVPGYTLVNMRLDWAEPFGATGITASAFVKNVTKEYYFTGGGGGVQANGTNSVNLGQPRTFGVILRANF